MPQDRGILQHPTVAKLAIAFLGVATALIAVQLITALQNVNEPLNGQQNIITVNGEGKVSAVPDLATISFTVSEDATTQSAAQDAMAKKVNAALDVLKKQGIADKDVQTSSYSVNPKYNYPEPCAADSVRPCIYNSNPTIIGYTASESVTVKVRKTDAVGTVVTALGGAGISNVYGPNFTIEDPNAIQDQARAKAIADARSKADELAKELGVRLVRVVNFTENGGGGYPMPYMAAGKSMSADAAPTVPQIPTGENEVTVDVSVTYEIH